MEENIDNQAEEVVEEAGGEFHHHDLLELFDELTLREKFNKFFYGLSQPHDSGAYKWSQLQLQRMSAPIFAVIVPLLFLALLMIFGSMQQKTTKQVNVKVKQEKQVEKLDEPEDIPEEQPMEPPEPVDVDFVSDSQLAVDVDVPTPSQNQAVSPMPATVDSVATIKSPVVMRGILGNRSGGARGQALKAYGGNGITEGAVIRALRWLKKNQHEDGSWGKARIGMTGLAILTYLAHGDTPSSEEFGETIEKGIKYLISKRRNGGWPRAYQHSIATYALCEAYALTKNPLLKDVCEQAVEIIINGQNPTGGWRYSFKPPDSNDTSTSAWAAQALKSAEMAGLENPKLKDAMKLAIMGFQANASPAGGFGYTGPGQTGLTGAGVLCMQLLGAANKPEAKMGLKFLDTWVFDWENSKNWHGSSPTYYWYYTTEAKFQAGGKHWNSWNDRFWKTTVKHQIVEKDAIEGPDGTLKDIGHWVSPAKKEHDGGNKQVMPTCLMTLQLEVYYRYLPTYKHEAVAVTEDNLDLSDSEDDLGIDIDI